MFVLHFFAVVVVLLVLLQLAVCSSTDQAFSTAVAIPKSLTCSAPMALGMESGELPDEWLFASSSFHQHSLGPHNARIRNDRGGGAWCPRAQIQSDSYEFIQVDFASSHEILGVEVQGRHANGSGREWAEALVIDFLMDGGTNWTRYEDRRRRAQILPANRDQRSAVLIPLDPPLFAVSVRLVPFSAQLRTVCLRFELYGCAGDGKVQQQQGVVKEGGDDGTFVLPLLPLVLIPSSFVLSLLLLAFFVRYVLRRAISPDQKGLFGTSSVGSPPLMPSSSWQNVRLPFDTSNAKVFSPSFCRFETVSLGWPPSLRSSPAPPAMEWEQQRNCCFDDGGGVFENGELLLQRQQHVVARSRSLHAAACIGAPTQTTATIPVRPVQICQLAHSCSQPESFRAVTRPLCNWPKPVPKPRKATNFVVRTEEI
uniref:F5/8 type C domain-containing protein n=1 Tax=Globodera pallida TaxID=36090 RepID=A0A183BSF7_GLOPA